MQQTVEATLTIAHFSSKYKTFCSYRSDCVLQGGQTVYYRVVRLCTTGWQIIETSVGLFPFHIGFNPSNFTVAG